MARLKKTHSPLRSLARSKGFRSGKSPEWYSSYNDSKHDRQQAFKKANLRQVIDALAGLLAVISSQFRDVDFSAGPDTSSGPGTYHDLEPATGSLFRIRYPDDWQDHEKYDFDWNALKNDADRFSKINYDSIVV